MSELFDPLLATGPVATATSDPAWLQAMLDAEAALALASADSGLLAAGHAATIAAACRAELYDAAEIGRAAIAIGNPVGPLVRALTARVADADTEAARAVHRGATSQDILDSAAMLVARRCVDLLIDQLRGCARRLADLTEQHAGTPQVGRSLLQQALPTTFGATTAVWLSAIDEAIERLTALRPRLAAQLGGAAGTLASLDGDGIDVLTAYARRLGLAEPTVPWHTERTRVTEVAAAAAIVCGVTGKIARDVTLLAQTEVGEVEEVAAGSGGSSTLPHKRNPIAAVLATAAAAQAPGLTATLFAAAVQEHQRAAGSWHAEWRPFTELLRSTGTAVHWLRTSLDRLRVHPARMRANLAATGGLLLAERVTTELAALVGRLPAHEAVTDCARRASDGDGDFIELLTAHPLLSDACRGRDLRRLLEPTGYLGSTGQFVTRALAAHRRPHPDPASSVPTTRAVDVAHRVDGPENGTPILLANSIGSDSSIWSSWVKPLTDNGFRVIRHDMRGHGDSPVPAGPYGIDDLGADALALLDRLGVERAHIVGVSLGGMLALWLAQHVPERVHSIVICCSSAHPGNRDMWIARAAQARADGMAEIADGSITRWLTPEWRDTHADTARTLRELTANTPAEGYAACCELLADLDLRTRLPEITAPALALSGADDYALPAEHSRLIADRIPHARFETIDQAAHLGTVEQAARFLTLTLEHLREHP